MAGRGSLRGDGAWPGGRGVAGGLEQGDWGLGRFSKGLEGAKGLGGLGPGGGRGAGVGGGWTLRGPDGRSLVRSLARSFVRSDGHTEIPPVFYRTSSPSGQLPKSVSSLSTSYFF